MYTEIIYLVSALLGFILIFLISNQYKTNRYTNIYLITIFLVSSIRNLFNGFFKISINVSFLSELDVFFYVLVFTLFYLYFTNLIRNRNTIIKKDLNRFLFSFILFVLTVIFGNYYQNRLLLKIVLLLIVFTNLYYVIRLFLILNKFIWNRNSDIELIVKQQGKIKQWSLLFFSFLIFIFIKFIILFNDILIFDLDILKINDEYLWIEALIWIFFYFKILLKPELLYGYEVFHNKIDEYENKQIIFDNVWKMNVLEPITNVQDSVLKEKILQNLHTYMVEIENIATNSSDFFTQGFNLATLAHRMNIPKSHLVYIFKYHSNISFIDFKKIIRIQKSKDLIHDGYLKLNTFESLATEVGFSTYSAFFKSFKSIEGVSPQEYYTQIKKTVNNLI